MHIVKINIYIIYNFYFYFILFFFCFARKVYWIHKAYRKYWMSIKNDIQWPRRNEIITLLSKPKITSMENAKITRGDRHPIRLNKIKCNEHAFSQILNRGPFILQKWMGVVAAQQLSIIACFSYVLTRVSTRYITYQFCSVIARLSNMDYLSLVLTDIAFDYFCSVIARLSTNVYLSSVFTDIPFIFSVL